jgi:hypothetical protein
MGRIDKDGQKDSVSNSCLLLSPLAYVNNTVFLSLANNIPVNRVDRLRGKGEKESKVSKPCDKGRAIVQVVSHWLPTVVAQFQAQVWSCGICGRQSIAGAGFLQVLRFTLPIFIPPTAPQSSSSIIWAWHNKPVEASLTPLNSVTNFLHLRFSLV